MDRRELRGTPAELAAGPVGDPARELERARADIDRTLADIRAGVQETTNWRGWFDRHPVALSAGAALGGLWLGSKVGGIGKPQPAAARRRARGDGHEETLSPAAKKGLAATLGGVLLTTLLRRFGPMLVERGIALATSRLKRRAAERDAEREEDPGSS